MRHADVCICDCACTCDCAYDCAHSCARDCACGCACVVVCVCVCVCALVQVYVRVLHTMSMRAGAAHPPPLSIVSAYTVFPSPPSNALIPPTFKFVGLPLQASTDHPVSVDASGR